MRVAHDNTGAQAHSISAMIGYAMIKYGMQPEYVKSVLQIVKTDKRYKDDQISITPREDSDGWDVFFVR